MEDSASWSGHVPSTRLPCRPRQLVGGEWNAIGRERREKGSISWASLSKLPRTYWYSCVECRVGHRAWLANTDYLPHTMRRCCGYKGRLPSQLLFDFLSEQVSPEVTNTRSSLTKPASPGFAPA